ncbi:hypothetical protein ACNHKD_07365 [Methylocystis sp. JAN1]|uniref:hypothetical protein n=1 Tax=Methylocystis sp. JAN1 TaxID=3397211 RepID=UPI003FA1D380
MRKIVLVRHGPVALKATGLLSFEAFGVFVDAYESAGLAESARPPESLSKQLADVAAVLASDAPRVRETLARLDLRADVVAPDFREAPPVAPRTSLRLPVFAWLALARARGEFSPALAEARHGLRRRAGACAERLAAASESGPAALVGHGWFNRYVAAALAARGWRKADGPGFAHPWGYLRLERRAR